MRRKREWCRCVGVYAGWKDWTETEERLAALIDFTNTLWPESPFGHLELIELGATL